MTGIRMEFALTAVLTIGAAVVAVPVAIFFIEVLSAITLSPGNATAAGNAKRDLGQRVGVLVPAHNESAGLLPTIADIAGHLCAGDRLLVVADNCTDDTAAVAAAGGAEVIERRDLTRIGKGYALDFGLAHLASQPPDIVIVVDADCRLADDAIGELAVTCAATHRPVQASYVMRAPPDSRINHQVAEFAWRVKNRLRPSGLKALGLPCQLTGTGMAFPWDVIRGAALASGCVVEDLKLGLDLAAAGHPPVFCPSAGVTSEFASSAKAAQTQRQRWEGGHISMILTMVPQLLRTALTRRDWNLLALTLDLAVPPLSLLTIVVIGTFAVAVLYAIAGLSSLPLAVSAAALAVFMLTAFLAWLNCGRDVVPPGAALSIARYIIAKLGLYRSHLFGRTDAQWIKTDRSKPD